MDSQYTSKYTGTVSDMRCLGKIYCKYQHIYELFGKPNRKEVDRYKVSTEWIIEDTMTGAGFCHISIYDYKATNLYSEKLPSVKDFRNSNEYYCWHLSGSKKETVMNFKKWLKGMINDK